MNRFALPLQTRSLVQLGLGQDVKITVLELARLVGEAGSLEQPKISLTSGGDLIMDAH